MAEGDMNRIQACVTEVAGLLCYTSLKDEQRLCMAEFISGRDVFVVLPTGFGKIACFTFLPFAFDLCQERDLENRAIIIVISPLTALILDKVEAILHGKCFCGLCKFRSYIRHKEKFCPRIL